MLLNKPNDTASQMTLRRRIHITVHKKRYHNMWEQFPRPFNIVRPCTCRVLVRVSSYISVWIRFLARIHLRMRIRMCTRGQIWIRVFGRDVGVGTYLLWVLGKSSTDSTELLSGFFLFYLQVWTRVLDRSCQQRMGLGCRHSVEQGDSVGLTVAWP